MFTACLQKLLYCETVNDSFDGSLLFG